MPISSYQRNKVENIMLFAGNICGIHRCLLPIYFSRLG
jgi:hypothetical protein